jgi:hypothetical protein
MSKLITKERKSQKELEMLFDNQWLILKKRGCPKQILEIFKNQKNEVVSVASRISFAKGNLPILLVLPRTYLTIYSQMPMVRNGKVKGYTTLDPTAIFEIIETPRRPYYLLNVENGQATLGKSPEEADNLIQRQGRLSLTEVETINLAIQTDVLLHHCLDATGCHYADDSRTPHLGLNRKRPFLFWYRLKYGHLSWGSPSCAKRLSF